MKIGLAQINPTVGDLNGNFEKIAARLPAARRRRRGISHYARARAHRLSAAGSLVFKSQFVPQNLEMLERLHALVGRAPLLVGFVAPNEGRGKPFHNAAALLEQGAPIRQIAKSSNFSRPMTSLTRIAVF